MIKIREQRISAIVSSQKKKCPRKITASCSFYAVIKLRDLLDNVTYEKGENTKESWRVCYRNLCHG